MKSPGKGNLPQEQQLIITVKDLRVFNSAYFDIKICSFCMCVQTRDVPRSESPGNGKRDIGHFSRFQTSRDTLAHRKSAFLDIRICQEIMKYIHRLISRNIKKYQEKQFLILEYVGILGGKSIR